MTKHRSGYLAKKSWHTQTIKNVEKVWKAEQAAEVEKQKVQELLQQRAEERERARLRQLKKDAGYDVGPERLEWMYRGPGVMASAPEDAATAASTTSGGAASVSSESSRDFLMGKEIDAPLTAAEEARRAAATAPEKELGLFQRNQSAGSVQDQWSKLREDPMMAIMKQRQEQLDRVRSNPLKMREIQRRVQETKEARRQRKKEKKARKKEKKEARRKKKRRLADDADAPSFEETDVSKKVTLQDTSSAAEKRSGVSNSPPSAEHRSRKRSRSSTREHTSSVSSAQATSPVRLNRVSASSSTSSSSSSSAHQRRSQSPARASSSASSSSSSSRYRSARSPASSSRRGRSRSPASRQHTRSRSRSPSRSSLSRRSHRASLHSPSCSHRSRHTGRSRSPAQSHHNERSRSPAHSRRLERSRSPAHSRSERTRRRSRSPHRRSHNSPSEHSSRIRRSSPSRSRRHSPAPPSLRRALPTSPTPPKRDLPASSLAPSSAVSPPSSSSTSTSTSATVKSSSTSAVSSASSSSPVRTSGYGLVFPRGKRPPPIHARLSSPPSPAEVDQQPPSPSGVPQRSRVASKHLSDSERAAALAAMSQDAEDHEQFRLRQATRLREEREREEAALQRRALDQPAEFIGNLNRQVYMEQDSLLSDQLQRKRHFRVKGSMNEKL